jgi:hypothetical protein
VAIQQTGRLNENQAEKAANATATSPAHR